MNVTVELDIVEYYLSRPWSWRFQEVTTPEGSYYEATIDEIPDYFAAASNLLELAMNARDALMSHVRSYLATGKPIPMPRTGRSGAAVGARVSNLDTYAVAAN